MKLTKKSTTKTILIHITIIIIIAMCVIFCINKTTENIYTKSLIEITYGVTDCINKYIENIFDNCKTISSLDSFKKISSSLTSNNNSIDKQHYYYINNLFKNTVKYNDTYEEIMFIKNNKILFSSNPQSINTIKDDFINSNVPTANLITTSENIDKIVISYPVFNNYLLNGYIVVVSNNHYLKYIMQSFNFSQTGILFYITSNYKIVGDHNSPTTLESIDDYVNIQRVFHKTPTNKSILTYKDNNNHKRYMTYIPLNLLNIVIGSSIKSTDFKQASSISTISVIFLLIIVISILIYIKHFIFKNVLTPLSLLKRSLYFLKKGDLLSRFNYKGNCDFGEFSGVFNNTIKSLQELTTDLKSKEQKNNIILSNLTDVIWEYNIEKDIIKMSEKWSSIIGMPFVQTSYLYTYKELIRFINNKYISSVKKAIEECIKNGTPICVDFIINQKNDGNIWVKMTGSCMYDIYNQPYMIIGSIFNITKVKEYENKLLLSATCDDLTNLIKKTELERLINLDLESNKIEHYLLLLDLDEFKTINDTYGHLVGDKAIVFAAKTFTSLCNNKCYIGRFGGDEFIIYTKERYDKHEIVSLVNEIIKTFNNGFEHNNITIKLSCSIGISVSPYNGTDYKELLKKSDLTIYEVKNSGKNSYKFY